MLSKEAQLSYYMGIEPGTPATIHAVMEPVTSWRSSKALVATSQIHNIILARHCAAVLSGLRPANLFSLHTSTSGSRDGILRQIDAYRTEFGPTSLAVSDLCHCENRVLIYLYAPVRLLKWCDLPENREILKNADYPEFVSEGVYEKEQAEAALTPLLAHLSHRVTASCHHGEPFPHEIGVFLGYPIEDVIGFMKYKGARALCSGYWKVYADRPAKEALFKQISYWETRFCEAVAAGFNPASLVRDTACPVHRGPCWQGSFNRERRCCQTAPELAERQIS